MTTDHEYDQLTIKEQKVEIKRLRAALMEAVQFAEDFGVHRAWVDEAKAALRHQKQQREKETK